MGDFSSFSFFFSFFFFLFGYTLIVNVFDETGYAWNPALSIPPLYFLILFLKKPLPFPHISFFLTESNPNLYNLSVQISDETWYTWLYQTLTDYPDSHSQNQ